MGKRHVPFLHRTNILNFIFKYRGILQYRNFIPLKGDSDFFNQGNQRFIAGVLRQWISLLLNFCIKQDILIFMGNNHLQDKRSRGFHPLRHTSPMR